MPTLEHHPSSKTINKVTFYHKTHVSYPSLHVPHPIHGRDPLIHLFGPCLSYLSNSYKNIYGNHHIYSPLFPHPSVHTLQAVNLTGFHLQKAEIYNLQLSPNVRSRQDIPSVSVGFRRGLSLLLCQR